MARQEYLYFTNDGSGRTYLGPAPVNGLNYQRQWVENNPKTDNGELMYGLFTALNGNYDSTTGNITPGHGFPLSPSPFESRMSLTYRTWQWARSAPFLVLIFPAIFAFLSLFFVLNNTISSFFAYATGYMLSFFFLLAPLLVIWAIWFVLSNAKISRREAERQIEDRNFSDADVKVFVEQHRCPKCDTNALRYDTMLNEASCPAGHGSPWRIAF